MAFPGNNYAPPSVYTQTFFENPIAGAFTSLKIPVFIGEGNEFLYQTNLEVVRGSSSSIDQERFDEDEYGRAVVRVLASGQVVLGDWDGVITKFQVRNFPIVNGNGTGTPTINRADVKVTIDNQPMVVRSVNGVTGIVELAQAPKKGQVVRCTYFFKRTDTLITDNVSDQVPNRTALVRALSGIADVDSQAGGTATLNFHGDITNPQGEVIVPANNVLNMTVDGVTYQITIAPRSNYTVAQVAAVITSARAGTLTAARFTNNFGLSALQLNATCSLVVLDGSANALLGLNTGMADLRTSTFYTFQRPIVTGNNGGVTTTDPANVVVKVNGVQVVPTAVNGATGAVTLPVAPKAGAVVAITYYFNAWQDTFDYLANNDTTQILACGDVPDTKSYIQDADFVLQDGNKIMWGTAVSTRAGVTTTGSTLFNEAQISTLLVDYQNFLSACVPVLTTSGGISVDSQTMFQLPMQPTLGNGRNTPLGQSLFQTVSNGRIDVPTDRPDLVQVYWGYDPQDALERGQCEVLKVEGLVVTLAQAIPVGATVYATFYYNTLVDNTYTLTCAVPGVSGTGTYTITDVGGNPVYNPNYDMGSKGAALSGVTIEFPSGSEYTPDTRYESVSGDLFTGPVSEIVTVQFGNNLATPAKFAVPGGDPYEFISSQSDNLWISLDGTTTHNTLSNPMSRITGGWGMFANLLGNEIVYTGGGSAVVGKSYEISGAEELTLNIDNAIIPVKTKDAIAAATVQDFVDAINEAASGVQGAARAGEIATMNSVPTAGGLGYHVGDILTITTGGTGATLVVTSLAGSAVATFDIVTRGVNYTIGAGKVTSVVPPGGAGCTVEITAIYDATDTITLASTASDIDNYYVGWKILLGNGATGTPVGIAKTITAYDGATKVATVDSIWTAIPVAADPYYLYNPEARSAMKTATAFNSAVTITAPAFNTLNVSYTNGSGSTSYAATIADDTYNSANELAVAMQVALDAVMPSSGALAGLKVECIANSSNQLEFRLQLPGLDSAGFIQFIADGTAAHDFAILAGLDTGAIGTTTGAGQAALAQAPVARAYTVASTAGFRPYDRIVLRNRLLPGGTGSLASQAVAGQTLLSVLSGNTKAALETGMSGVAGQNAVVTPATLVGSVGFGGGQTSAGQPQVTFYDGTGSYAANNNFSFVLDGVAVAFNFTASASGTATALGPIGTSGTILNQIVTAMAAIPGAPFGDATAIMTTYKLIRQEGAGIRITGRLVTPSAGVTINSGSANALLGFSAGQAATRTLVTAGRLASALMADTGQASFASWTLTPNVTGAATFASIGLASVVTDLAGRNYLYAQHAPTVFTSMGVGSTVAFLDATTQNALLPVTGLLVTNGQGATGEPALNGFFVTSNNPNGSGSANTSVLHNGVGQDGSIGQTYRDLVTGLTFTVLPRGWAQNHAGPWVDYPVGGTSTFRIYCGTTVTTNANIPNNALKGVELIVANTIGVGVGNTALVETFERGGNEPMVGDVYYVSYQYLKKDYTTAFYTKMSAIEAAYGAISPDNPLTLAAYLSIINGAVVVGLKQVPREPGSDFASIATYRDAITELEGNLPGQIKPDMITPLRGDSTQLYQYLKSSNEVMSSIRYKSERTSIIGVSAGTIPQQVISLAQTLGSTRMRIVYPDMVTVSLTNGLGAIQESLIDGPYLAAALTGSIVSPNVDVATPWTNRKLVGFTQLGRQLDAVEQNQIAVKGVTVLEDQPPFIKVRQGLTTDMTNVLTKLPTIVLIADEVQQQARATLDKFIGIKFLPGILSQIEGRLCTMLKNLVAAQIISAYTGVKANVSVDDPTTAEVVAWYSPVFPLLYIVVTFNLRSSL